MSYQVSRRALIGNAALTPLSLFHSEMPPSLRPQSERSNEERVKSLWERLMRPFLSDPQWVDDFAYDAGHALMIPLHAAYSATAEESWTADMLHHTKLLGSAIRDGAKLSNNRIALQQYLYVFTQVFTQQAILQRDTGREDLIDFDLMQRIEGIQAALWTREPAPQWDRKPFDNMYERILWKENITDPPFSFYRAIIDEEFFNFAIAADLCNLFGDDTSVEAREAVKVADRLFERYGNHTDEGGWLFQPGVWWDHRDYAYAGYSEPSHDMRPRPIKGIATDTSHSHRFARWLLSLRDAGGSSKSTAGHQKALQGLEFQLTRKVLQHHRRLSHTVIEPRTTWMDTMASSVGSMKLRARNVATVRTSCLAHSFSDGGSSYIRRQSTLLIPMQRGIFRLQMMQSGYTPVRIRRANAIVICNFRSSILADSRNFSLV